MKRTLDIVIVGVIALNIVVVGALLGAVVLDRLQAPQAGHPVQASAVPSASAELMQMGLAHIPTSDACVLCHESGGSANIKVVPAIGHPLEGWRRCAACHTGDRLGATAPGHAGIPETECLNCHKVAPMGPAITQPHSRLQDQKCLDCHGSYAHLPSSMVGKNPSDCTLCHKPTALPPPAYPHSPEAMTSLNCKSCHQSVEVGALPMTHALYTDSMCLLCHEIKTAGTAPGSPGSPAASPIYTLEPSASPSGG
jgi:hypothetical protein